MKFSNVQINDTLWTMELGECRVKDKSMNYMILGNDHISLIYSYNGFIENSSFCAINPTCFFSKPEIIEKQLKVIEGWMNLFQRSPYSNAIEGDYLWPTEQEAFKVRESKASSAVRKFIGSPVYIKRIIYD